MNQRSEISAGWPSRHPLLAVALTPVLAVLVSVIFNVWYSATYIQPLLTPKQNQLLLQSLTWFNAVVFPLAGGLWGAFVAYLRAPMRALRAGQTVDASTLEYARARAINLPWHFAVIVGVSNLCVVLVLRTLMSAGDEPVYAYFTPHLIISVAIAALITITIGFFLVELMTQQLIFPLLFRGARPYQTPHALPLSLPMRALLMAVAGGIGPIIMLLLIGWADDAAHAKFNLFRIAVGLLGIGFSFAGAWLFGSLVMTPIRRLSRASRAVAEGQLDTRVDMLRADEFGALADEFNHMVHELREKQKLRETFGLHVGEAAAQQILSRDAGLGGRDCEITVMFCDIRGFTAYSAGRAPAEIVGRLNEFLSRMVDIVEARHGGMINKYLGDGFMALFGAAGGERTHAASAIAAAREMLARPDAQFSIGIGIHSGHAVVGNIGSVQRLEYTAIGETVNLASRVEGLTKALNVPLLFTAATRERLSSEVMVRSLGEQSVRGQPQPVAVFTLC